MKNERKHVRINKIIKWLNEGIKEIVNERKNKLMG